MNKKGKLYKIPLLILTLLLFAFPVKVQASEINKELTLKNLSVQALAELKDAIDQSLEKSVSHNEFLSMIEKGNVKQVFLEFKDFIYFIDTKGTLYETPNPNSITLKEDLLKKDIEILTTNDFIEMYKIEKPTQTNNNDWIWFLTIPLIMFGMPFALRLFYKNMIEQEEEKAIAGQKAKDRAEQAKLMENAKKFDDVAGLKEVKEDVQTLVDFIVNGEKYKEMGAKLPRGVILYGPPGTGKTLLARAIAGEAGVPFYQTSGADFVEKYVGMGAKRIREIFAKAKKNAPCIIFIDEIDAIAGKRGGNDENGEDRKTINALLTEMDGFTNTDDVLVIGATNRLEDLDEAVLRPGRFTNKYCVPLPESFEDRLTIIELYSKNKRLLEDVNLRQLAKMTIGCSPAEIENILNEAAIIATRNGLIGINAECIEDAFNKNIFKGHVKKDTFNRRKKELELVAWHEAGHALAGILLGENVNKVTILSSTTGAGGATFTIPKKLGLHSTEDLKKQIIGLYAGRCAEYILLGDADKITTGASNDIERATEIIYQMVAMLGMNEDYGMLNLHKLRMGDQLILQEASKLAKEMERICIELLTKHRKDLEKIVELLLENETIYDKDMKFITARENLSDYQITESEKKLVQTTLPKEEKKTMEKVINTNNKNSKVKTINTNYKKNKKQNPNT